MPTQDSNIILKNRYPGVKPFITEEKGLFFGRDKDIVDLFSLIFVKQMVVLYGKSGFGKSSLINAGIIPKLHDTTSFQHFAIRFNNLSTSERTNLKPHETLIERIKSNINLENLNELALLDITDGETSLWYWIKILQKQKKNGQIILFFDQFEELFTYQPVDIDAFSAQIADTLYSPIPVKYRSRLETLDEEGKINDEFHDFLYEKPEIKIIFSVRADRLSLLNSLTNRHPTILTNCYELAPLSPQQAEEAIIKPAILTSQDFQSKEFTYTKEAIIEILKNIEDKQSGKIETSILQIVCRYVEDKLVRENQKSIITVNDLGKISYIFQEYYEDLLSAIIPEKRDKIQEFIEEKLISNNQRNSLSESYIISEFGVSTNELFGLEQKSILRKERGVSGQILYELSHDTLIEPIQLVAKTRLEIKEAEKKKALEVEIENEKRRNVKLTNLSRIAWVVSIIAIIVAIIAGYYWFEAVKSKEEASNNLETARQFFEETNLKEVDRILGIANNYMDYGEDSLALSSLFVAKNLLDKNATIFSPNFTNTQGLNSERIILNNGYSIKNKAKFEKKIKLLNEKIVLCENKLKKP